ncbi:ATP/GTP-binding protein [Dysgonomonas sp. 25]|uniref:AAA family ATPase n=1 Tax=Dysgonomonas sp. 25 TaxID=2302933 RepID=UPI0013D4BB3B|nr:AAA family ATPase [Dysgonomonas sp. 25]NDV67650.1 ATP-binding protein [Dysgonomonas sp. 25]
MLLKALKYTRFQGEPREWKIIGKGKPGEDAYAEFGNLNLLVGKNASGKSRTLNVVRTISDLFTGNRTVENTFYPTERYELILGDDETDFRYCIGYKNREITEEVLVVNGKKIFDRTEASISVDPVIPAITVIQNEYSYPIVKWGASLKSFMFSNQYEKNHLVEDYTVREARESNPNETENLIYTFYRGLDEFGDEFVRDIVQCMQHIGYPVSEVKIKRNGKGYGLAVEEDGKYTINQHEMSHGMFRALAMFIHLTYALMKNLEVCVLLDDIGEGIDFDRSREMMGVISRKINNSNLQMFITTNDRYIMNNISLRYWTVIDRKKEESVFYNYMNSKETFEDFRYTGLNNFDFLATDFYKKGFGTEEEDDTPDTED